MPRKTRRAPGAGTVIELPSGRFRVQVRTLDGGREGHTFDTRAEADAFRAALVVERAELARRAAAEAASAPRPDTLAAWGARWLERRAKRVRWPAQDKSRWRLHVAPSALAALPLGEIRARDVRAWARGLLDTKLSHRTARHVFNLLRVALGDAVEDELIPANPATGVKLPSRPGEATDADELHFLTAEEVARVEAPAPGVPEAARLLYTVAIRTGLRQGELWALRWGDVREADARPVVVVRASHGSAPKNGKVQSVPLLPAARAAFARLRELAGDPKPDALVFPSPRGHRRQPSDDAGWSTRKVRGKARVGHRELLGVNPLVHFHGLRHTFASHLVMGTWGAPMPLAEVRALMRHEDVDTTDRYAHLAPDHLHARVAAAHPAPTPPVCQEPPVSPAPVAHAPGPDTHETPSFQRRAVQESNLWPWASETHGPTRETPGTKVFPRVVCPACATRGDSGALRGAALALLEAVDAGDPAGDLARALAVEALRRLPPDSPGWCRALEVLEGGPLRMRRAVDLAGLALDATDAADAATG